MVRTLPRFPSLTLPTSPLPPRRNIPDRAGPPTPAAPPPLRLGAALPLTRLLLPPGRPRPPAGERLFRLPSRLPPAVSPPLSSAAYGAPLALRLLPPPPWQRSSGSAFPFPGTLSPHPHPALPAVRGFVCPGLRLVCSPEASSAPGAVSKRNSGNFGRAAVRGLFRSSAGFSPRPRCSSSSAVLFVCGPESCNVRSPMGWIMCAVTGLGRKAGTSRTMGVRGLRLRECDASRCACVCESHSVFLITTGLNFPFSAVKLTRRYSMESCSILRRH